MKPAIYRATCFAIAIWYVSLVFVYSWLIPPFEYADEPRHLAYAHWLAEGRGFPPQGAAAWETPIMQEAGQPPLLYLITAVPLRLLLTLDPQAWEQYPLIYRPNPTSFVPAPRTAPDNDNHALHTASDMQPLRGMRLALVMMRVITAVFGAILLLMVYLLTRELFPTRPWLPLATTFATAAIPQVLYISSVVSNDIPVAALSTAALWQLVRLLKQPQRSTAVWLGLCASLAILTKISALALLPAIAAGLAWQAWRHPQQRPALAHSFLWLSATVALLTGWWFGRTWLLYGSPFGLEAHDYAPWAFNEQHQRPAVWLEWANVFRSLWASVGWGPVTYPDWVYGGLAGLVLLALVGLGRRLRRPLPRPCDSLIVAWGVLFLLTAVLLEVWMRRVSAPFGRLLYPALAPLVISLVYGWHKSHRLVLATGLSSLALLALATPSFILQPTFHPQPLSPAEIARLPEPIGWQFGDFAELISVEPLAQDLRGESLLPVRVCYRALRPTAVQHLLLLQLVGPGNHVLANRYTIPGLGTYPTIGWRAGDVLCDRVTIRVWDNIEQTLLYKINIGFSELDSGTTVPVFGAEGSPLSSTFVAEVRLVADPDPAGAPPLLPTPPSAPPVMVYAPTEPAPHQTTAGQTITVPLRWQVNQPTTESYQTFLHLRTADNVLVAQADGPPLNGWYPTSWWRAGELISDARALTIPADTPAGAYDLVAGFYSLQTGARWGAEFGVGQVTVGDD
ncbi:MAG: glycosyltransferase family 39 protein [Anaerolineales bacterium]|nr:glycosyltransferase family 39 protein [Anaerolineales bacterium]